MPTLIVFLEVDDVDHWLALDGQPSSHPDPLGLCPHSGTEREL